jgi:hypothetical protein
MKIAQKLAQHLRQVYFGGNWTSVHYKQVLQDIAWQDAYTQRGTTNSIALLVYHTTYYLIEVAKVLQGEPLLAKDTYSFLMPEIRSEEAWQQMCAEALHHAEKLASLIEQLDEATVFQYFTNEKYGDYYGNMQGIVEHCHYHLGQIVLLKSMIGKEG